MKQHTGKEMVGQSAIVQRHGLPTALGLGSAMMMNTKTAHGMVKAPTRKAKRTTAPTTTKIKQNKQRKSTTVEDEASHVDEERKAVVAARVQVARRAETAVHRVDHLFTQVRAAVYRTHNVPSH